MPVLDASPSPAQTATKANTQKPRSGQPLRKKRIGRRRGRAKGGIESDDEIEREAGTDSEFDDDDDQSSSLDSATEDSDTEPASEDAPSHTQSPTSSKVVGVGGVAHINGGVAAFFSSTSNWSDMVAEENANGAANIPVIEFADFDSAAKIPARQRKKAQKPRKQPTQAPAPTAPPPDQEPSVDEESNHPESQQNSFSGPPRKPGQTARQAYQQRLETDPSYVPKVGGFWGHDDRLMEKDLRSLSGWWRGRWQGRGRGRGFGMRGGPRGNFDLPVNDEANAPDLPPVERTWTHDGFEEMRRKEDERRKHHDSPVSPPSRGRASFRGGRGGFAGRGKASMRGGFGSSPASSVRTTSPLRQNRVWFAMKPELKWSKQSEAFLFYEPTFKGRHGQAPGFRVKLPGKEGQVARPSQPLRASTHLPVAHSEASSSERQELQYVVRLPKRKDKADEQVVEPQEAPSLQATREEDVHTVQPHPVPTDSTITTEPLPTTAPAASSILSHLSPPPPVQQPALETDQPRQGLPTPSVVSQLEQLSLEFRPSDPEGQARTEEAVLRNPSTESYIEAPIPQASTSAAEQRPILPPLQTVFTPPPPPMPQPSPVYGGSPYAFAQSLPPGIALNHHGMPYEVATGRPVYLQPPPMYNPRPLMHSHLAPPGLSYGHMHHPSAVSPDFLAQPPSHTPPMNGFIDSVTGAPLFSFPRPTARIEIRAPDDSMKSSSSSNGVMAAARGPSKLRTSAATFEPMRSDSEGSDNRYYASINTPSDASTLPPSYETTNGVVVHLGGDGGLQQQQQQQQQQQLSMGAMMAYPAYQQPPYYYPEPYGYPAYMDMAQVGQYEMYNMDQNQQGTVYY